MATGFAAALADALAGARVRCPALRAEPAALAASLAAAGVDAARLAARGVELVLAHAAAAGDRAALAELERTTFRSVRDTVERYTRDPARTDDVVQRLRVHLLVPEPGAAARLARYDGRAGLGAWVGMCGVRLALHALREQRAAAEVALDWSHAVTELPADEPELERLCRAHRDRISAALGRACMELPRRERAIVRLLFVDGASLDAVARMYQVHRVTVWRWVEAARAQLARDLRHQLEDLGSQTSAVVAWVESQIDLSLDAVLAPTATG
jgi:RNA polymerase sigma-70 factor (ECF subfamily)